MTKSKLLGIVFLVLFAVGLTAQAGCASAGMKRPIIYADQPNNIPADTPSQFADRYYFLVDKEKKEFKKLLTDEERQLFIDKFWLDRDSDPSTPENEKKQEIDQRIDNISEEIFFSTFGAIVPPFRSNGGFRGDMAKVYLLHGEPDAIDTIESTNNLFVPLMLWNYGSPESGRVSAFLFYQKGGSGSFQLFNQDSYQMDRCGALYEIATLRSYTYFSGGGQACPEDLYEIYNEITYRSNGKGGNIEGYIFAWALFNFSSDPSLKQGEALQPPKPASEVAKKSKSRVVGEAPELTGKAGTDYILSSCETCNSMIPAEFSADGKFTLSAPWKNFDWTVKGEYLEVSLKHRIVLYGGNLDKPIVIKGISTTGIKRKLVEDNPDVTVTVDLLEPSLVASFPTGTYRMSVYIKSTLTPKYNSWDKQFVK